MINTGIKATPQFLDILSSVIGQMSDGIWENTRSMERYWKSLHYKVDENNCIVIVDKYRETSNPVEFFANKIKQIVKIEIDDNPGRGLVWSRSCSVVPQYLDRSWGSERPCVTVGDCYKLYDLLKNRRTDNNYYAGLKQFNLEVTWGSEVRTIQLWALSRADANKKVLEKIATQLQIREI